MKTENILQIALLAGIGYAVYKLADKFKQGLNTVTAPVAEAYTDLTDLIAGRHDIQSTIAGSAVFPNGARVPLSNLTVAPYNGPNGFEARVSYQGRTYRLTQHDANGNYPATPI